MASKRSVSFIIVGTTTKSGGVNLSEDVITGFHFPTGWAAGNVTFEVSLDGVTYVPVNKSDGTAMTLTATAADSFVALSPADMAWAGLYIKLVSSVAQTDMTVIANSVRVY